METKTCSLTEDEIIKLIIWHGGMLSLENVETHLDRMVYLNRRLKAEKKEVEVKSEPSAINTEIATKIAPTSEVKSGW